LRRFGPLSKAKGSRNEQKEGRKKRLPGEKESRTRINFSLPIVTREGIRNQKRTKRKGPWVSDPKDWTEKVLEN